MLDESERTRIVAFVEVGIADDPRGILLAGMPDRLKAALVANGDTRTLLLQAISLCESDGRNFDPPAIVTLLRRLMDYAINHEQEISAVADRLAVPPPPPTDPLTDIVIRGNMVLLDRHPLRQAVKRLLTNQTPTPILVVNGERYSGKSRTTFLIDHVGRCRPDIRFCRIRVDDEEERPTVEDVFRDMITRLGGDPDDGPPMTNERRWPRDLANRVSMQIKEASESWNGSWVLIFDGFNRDRLSEPIAAFVLQLASNIVEVSRTPHRLLLIDYDVVALARVAEHFEPVQLHDLSETEAVDELTRLLAPFGRKDVPKLVAGVLKDVPMPARDLRTLGLRCDRLLQMLTA